MKEKEETTMILERIYALFPGLKTELEYSTPFQFLIAVILSAQATDKHVNRLTKPFFEVVKTPADLVVLPLEAVESYFSRLNFFRNKSKAIKGCAEILVSRYDSVIPSDLNALMAFPGVGIKTAKVVIGVLYDAPYIGVDTHIHRICNRIGICKTKTPQDTDAVLERDLDEDIKRKAHHAMVLFGRYQCIARKPKCETCPISASCEYFKSR